MNFGSRTVDGGGLILSEEEKQKFIKENPISEKWIRPFIGAEEFISNKKRYCLWLKDADPSELRKCNLVLERIKFVKEFREKSKSKITRGKAETPTLFYHTLHPDTDYLLVPSTTSSTRKYIPIGFMDKRVIASNATHIIPNATLYEFGVLTSNVHMEWMKLVAGRLGNGYRYSKDIVYNNFPWPEPTKEQKDKIEETAIQILEVRKKYENSTLADLYNELTMPIDLRKAHEENDKAVLKAYGFKGREMGESELVEKLMALYNKIINEE